MRDTTSTHNIPIRTQAIQIWPEISGPGFMPNLNVVLLAKMIATATEDDTNFLMPESTKKRKAAESAQDTMSNKRTRTTRATSARDRQKAASDDEVSDGDQSKSNYYPRAELASNFVNAESEVIPALRHVLEIQYVNEVPPSGTGSIASAIVLGEYGVLEGGSLRDILLSLSESLSSPKQINIGEILLGLYRDRFVGMSAEDKAWLLLVPSLAIDAESNDFQSASASDLLAACRTLQQYGQAHLSASLQVTLYPLVDGVPKFSLQLEIVAAMVTPAILENLVPKGTLKRSILALQDARRRLLRAAYHPFEDVVSKHVNHPVTVSTFYNILGSAPAIPSKIAEDALQCEGLLPSLLPFQRRSVAWLLEREGMALTPEGTLVPQSSPEAFSFWQQIQEGNHTWYMNRLSADLSEEAPELPNVHGGMLAEEPGLGKTVETIALILMNPAQPEWNPTLSRWDDVSCMDVKAVKCTLIVTPPSLASQWRDELRAHAPSLKVLVYEGWTKVKVPITNSAREKERVAEIAAKDERKLKKASQIKVKRKGKGKGKKAAPAADANQPVEDVDDIYVNLARGDDGKLLDWCDFVHQFDVVITTYSVLRSEIHVARPGPDRPKREDATYSTSGRLRSPLVMVEWKRVVMDEVQMVGGGSAAEMVSLIPRLSSLAVSGTPAKAQMSDLIHVLKFLRIDKIVGDLRLWKRLLKPGFSEEFASFLRHYGIRTTKLSVANELTIPEQTRYLVPIELGRIEKHVYDQMLEQVLLDLGLDARGVAATSNWQVDGSLLRNSLRKLRGICTHPQVGQLMKKGDGTYKPNALKSMDAVLQLMRDQNWKVLMEDWKLTIQLFLKHAQLEHKDETIENRYQSSLKILQAAAKETDKYIEDIRDTLAKHDAIGKEMKEETALLRQERTEEPPVDIEKGKGKEVVKLDDQDADNDNDASEEDLEEKGLPKTPAGEEHRHKRAALKQRLREGRLLLHRVHFLLGDTYHVLGDTPMEEASYERAEGLRRELLRNSEDEASKAIAMLGDNPWRKSLTEGEFLVDVPLLGDGGIRSSYLMEELNTVVEDVLNEQSKLLWKWRSHIIDLLSQPLNPGNSEADGQEYQRTLDEQGEVETYLQSYVALLADRREALVNERTLLAAHDVREKRLRHTKAAMKAASAAAGDALTIPDGVDMQPEHEVMHSTLSTERKNLLLALKGRAVKSILVELHGIYLKIVNDKDPERLLIKLAVERIRSFITEQAALHDKLEGDLTLLRKSFNQRILYFGHLQEISDSVADVEWEEDSITAAIQACVTERAKLEAKINTTRARFRYLDNLARNKDTDNMDDENECVLCRCEFNRGYITHCGHVFCEMCMKAWLHRKDGKTCPVCRVPIDLDSVQRFVVNTADPAVPPPKLVAGEPVPQSHRKITYNTIDPATFEDIQSMETYGDFGSKIQTLVRHLAHIKVTDFGAKSIIFSAWADSLHIVEYALKENGIRALRIDQGASTIHKFRTDPEILVLLLHGERENAGLNVTCASRVFLLESVVHHSFEIQAIARIDRLGQSRPTEVYCYYAEETVERNILDLAARKGLSLYTSDNSKGTISVSPFNRENEEAIDDPATRKMLQKGDFIYKVDDMLAILFPHMYEDTEFLLPPSALALARTDTVDDVEMIGADGQLPQHIARASPVNAVAGPSRLS